MNNEQYSIFEQPFRAAVTPLLEQLQARLIEMGFGPFTKVDVIDLDECRGLGFELIADSTKYVELMLTDGDVHGFEGVGLKLDCSIFACGQVWSPGNYTEDVGMHTPEAVVERLNTQFSVEDIAQLIEQEWERLDSTVEREQN